MKVLQINELLRNIKEIRDYCNNTTCKECPLNFTVNAWGTNIDICDLTEEPRAWNIEKIKNAFKDVGDIDDLE